MSPDKIIFPVTVNPPLIVWFPVVITAPAAMTLAVSVTSADSSTLFNFIVLVSTAPDKSTTFCEMSLIFEVFVDIFAAFVDIFDAFALVISAVNSNPSPVLFTLNNLFCLLVYELGVSFNPVNVLDPPPFCPVIFSPPTHKLLKLTSFALKSLTVNLVWKLLHIS